MTTVALPLRVRIPAYVTSAVTALAGTPTVTYLAAEHLIDTPTTVFLGVLIAGIHLGADALALSHLTLPSEDSSSPETAAKIADLHAATAKLDAEVGRAAAAAAKPVVKSGPKAAPKTKA